jgi:transposase
MPKGEPISRELRERIHYYVTVLNYSSQEILYFLFFNDQSKMSISHLDKLRAFFRCANVNEVELYLGGPQERFQRGQSSISPYARQYLDSIMDRTNVFRCSTLTATFAHEFYPVNQTRSAPCRSTIQRYVHRRGFSRKVLEHRHILQDQEKRLRFLEDTAFVDPFRWVDIDELPASAKHFEEKYGYAPRGEDAIRMQIQIEGRQYSVIAAYSPNGFICWDIIEGSVDSQIFVRFMRETLADYLIPSNVALLDNAAIHRSEASMDCIRDVFSEKYQFSPPYSPDFKPIELGFSNVKNWLREHSYDAVRNPIVFINEAFLHYAIGAPKSDAGKLQFYLWHFIYF